MLKDKVHAFDVCLTQLERIAEQGKVTSRWLMRMDIKKVRTSSVCTAPRTVTKNPGYGVHDSHAS